MPGTSGNYQIIKRNIGTVSEPDLFVFLIKIYRFAEDHFDIFCVVKDPPNRLGDLARGKHGSRDLIEQRLKNVVILAVDERNLDRLVSQCLGRPEAAKTPSDYHNFW